MFGVSRYGLCRYDERFITDDGRFFVVLSQALPLLFDTSGAWSDMDVDAPEPELQKKLGVAPESLRDF